MNKTPIEWADQTWNPVTGCLHGCGYCYARRMVERFGKAMPDRSGYPEANNGCHMVESAFTNNPYPFMFEPTFHAYRLNEPQRVRKPQNIFVCSMADLFGNWVPDGWIEEILEACKQAPQHRYLFLTKNPARYMALASVNKLPQGDGFWYGTTITGPDVPFWWSNCHRTFVSIEPLLEPLYPAGDESVKKVDWAIIGAMTGPGSKDHQPEKWWVDIIKQDADTAGVPVFMKESLLPIMGEAGMCRDFPWSKP